MIKRKSRKSKKIKLQEEMDAKEKSGREQGVKKKKQKRTNEQPACADMEIETVLTDSILMKVMSTQIMPKCSQ